MYNLKFIIEKCSILNLIAYVVNKHNSDLQQEIFGKHYNFQFRIGDFREEL